MSVSCDLQGSVQCLTEQSSSPVFHGFHHITFWVGNALQASSQFCIKFGFNRLCYRGLETGSDDVATHVIHHGGIILVFESPLPGNTAMSEHVAKHGDGVKDIALKVSDCQAAWDRIAAAKDIETLKLIQSPKELSDDFGSIRYGRLGFFGDVTFTLIEAKDYTGLFLPGFYPFEKTDPLLDVLMPQGWYIRSNRAKVSRALLPTSYAKLFGFVRFTAFDETQIKSDLTALRSIVMADKLNCETVKLLAAEPVSMRGRSQIQEFIDYNQGEGIQHLAFLTSNIIQTVASLHQRGVEFLPCPPKAYYENLRNVLKNHPVQVNEDINILEKLHILLDYDENGYLLQILSRPLQDRPTFFVEIIERHNHRGFGEGNFRALFQAIEKDQVARRTLFSDN